MSLLFSPFTFDAPSGPLTLPNRIVVAPMCQYSADNGQATDWHLTHWTNMLNSGAGLFTIEATAVSAVGRISPGCLGLWDDATQAALADKLHRARRLAPNMPVCIQISHAGRKASSAAPWDGGMLIAPENGGWQTVAPSALPHLPQEAAPRALSEADLDTLVAQFVQAARRADAMGIEAIELHAAHGYLMHEFLSPLSNQRSDAHGGSFDNRVRFPLRVFDAPMFHPERRTLAYSEPLLVPGAMAIPLRAAGLSAATTSPGRSSPRLRYWASRPWARCQLPVSMASSCGPKRGRRCSTKWSRRRRAANCRFRHWWTASPCGSCPW